MISLLIIIAIFALFFFINFRRGIAAAVFNALGVALTGFIAYSAAGAISTWLYGAFVSDSLTENIEQLVNTQGADAALTNCFEALPDWARGIVNFALSLFGADSSLYTDGIDVSGTTQNAVSAVEELVKPVVTSIFTFFIAAVLSVIIFILVKLLISKLLNVFNIPVVRQINRFLGGVLGLAEAAVITFFGVNIYSGFLYYTNPEMLTNSMVSNPIFNFFSLFV